MQSRHHSYHRIVGDQVASLCERFLATMLAGMADAVLGTGDDVRLTATLRFSPTGGGVRGVRRAIAQSVRAA